MEAARAAERVKHACTIDESELLALRPTLLRGYASIHNQERSASCKLCIGNVSCQHSGVHILIKYTMRCYIFYEQTC